jgi:tetratricopeptide (TPR) repeat protein
MAGHPGDALVLLARKAALFLGPVETGGDIPFVFEKRRVPLLHMLGLASFTLLAALAAAGFVARGTLPVPRFPFLAALAVPLVTCLVFYVMARYRLPAWPLLVVAALPGLEAALRRDASRRTWAARTLLALGLVATAIGAAVPPSRSAQVAGWHNWGVAWQHAAEPGRAIAAYSEALAVEPAHRETLENLSQAHLGAGNLDAAAGTLRDLLARHPDSFVGWHGLATLHVYGKDWEAAAAAARKALALRSEEPATWLILAEASVRLDRAADACEALARIPRVPPRYPHLVRLKEECAGR